MIAITASAIGAALLNGRSGFADDAVHWQGSALGAQVSIEIYHPDRTEAGNLSDLFSGFQIAEDHTPASDDEQRGIIGAPCSPNGRKRGM